MRRCAFGCRVTSASNGSAQSVPIPLPKMERLLKDGPDDAEQRTLLSLSPRISIDPSSSNRRHSISIESPPPTLPSVSVDTPASGCRSPSMNPWPCWIILNPRPGGASPVNRISNGSPKGKAKPPSGSSTSSSRSPSMSSVVSWMGGPQPGEAVRRQDQRTELFSADDVDTAQPRQSDSVAGDVGRADNFIGRS